MTATPPTTISLAKIDEKLPQPPFGISLAHMEQGDQHFPSKKSTDFFRETGPSWEE